MPDILSRFKPGAHVFIACYQESCASVKVGVTLGKKYEIHPAFSKSGRVGRMRWNPNYSVKGFELGKTLGGSGYCSCPNCKTLFGGVIVAVSPEPDSKLIAFGYDPEPA